MSSGRTAALASVCSLVAGVVLMLALHVLPPTNEISPVRRTLSQYALGPNKWIFDLSVLLIALGSALAFVVLVRERYVRPLSGPTVLGALWTLSLLVVVWFTKTDWTVGPSTGGTIHRYASVVGFVALPIAVLVIARAVFPDSARWRLAARGFGVASLGLFGLIVVGVVRMAAGGGPWWLFVPLGLVERGIALTAVAAIAVVVLGVAVRAKSEDVVRVPA
ncbi:DUF998 domain-containing protein [Actinophytocola sp.]|jgi:hypothetical protein|uniref:DUF998 domain-containing protein n=1 Tax=Actinophytocola sp. TaxID=1872138 RepID=UPI002EDB8866